MNLGKEVAAKFLVMFMIGVMVIFITFVLAMLPGSPYRIEQAGSVYLGLHFSAGLLLFWSGFMGAVYSQTTEVQAAKYYMLVLAAVVQVAFLLAFLASVWDLVESLKDPAMKPIPLFVTTLGWLLGLLAVLTWITSSRYLLRVYRLHRPYRDQGR
jgi:hypothetical protein